MKESVLGRAEVCRCAVLLCRLVVLSLLIVLSDSAVSLRCLIVLCAAGKGGAAPRFSFSSHRGKGAAAAPVPPAGPPEVAAAGLAVGKATTHDGHQCSVCCKSPIVGVRYRKMDSEDDLCDADFIKVTESHLRDLLRD